MLYNFYKIRKAQNPKSIPNYVSYIRMYQIPTVQIYLESILVMNLFNYFCLPTH